MDEIDYRKIGIRIREARKKRGLTQEQASELCDITSSFYGNIERGDKKMSVETLVKIARGLSVSTDQLLFGNENEEEQALRILSQIKENGNETQYKKYLDIMKAVSTIIDKL